MTLSAFAALRRGHSVKSLKGKVAGLAALLIGSVLVSSAALIFALVPPGTGDMWFSTIRANGAIGLLLSLVGIFLLRTAGSRINRNQG